MRNLVSEHGHVFPIPPEGATEAVIHLKGTEAITVTLEEVREIIAALSVVKSCLEP